nr:hypothetical protein [Tanacetum cinerariifolium]
MTHSTVKRLTKPLEEPQKEPHMRRKAACHQQRNESLAIAGRNLFDDEASSFANSGPKPLSSLKSLSRTTTHDPPYHTPPSATTIDNTKRITKEGEPEGKETTTTQGNETSQSPTMYHPSKSSSVPFPSWLKKQQTDDDDERLLSISRQIHINLPFLEVIIHMLKGAKVLKDLLSHKKKIKKATSSVKLIEKCSTAIQRSLPQKERDPRSFTLPCLIRPLAVKNSLADFGLITMENRFETKKEDNREEIQAVSFYPRQEPIEPLEWKALENWLKPSTTEPSKLELKELPEHLEYAFLQENKQIPLVISFTLSAHDKTKLLEVVKNHKGAIAWSIAYINGIDLSLCTYKILLEDESSRPSNLKDGECESTTTNNRPNLSATLRAKAIRVIHKLQLILAFVDSRLESIKRFLNSFANQPNETDINNLESDNESVDTPLVSPFPHSDNDLNDGEVLNKLSEYENAGVLRRERIINSSDDDDLAFKCMIGFRKFISYLNLFLLVNIISRKAYNTIMVEGLEGTGKNLVTIIKDIYVFVGSFTYH